MTEQALISHLDGVQSYQEQLERYERQCRVLGEIIVQFSTRLAAKSGFGE